MTDFALDFFGHARYTGTGSSLPLTFFEHFPAEAGCIGLADVGDLILQAKVTDVARQMLTRSISLGKMAFQIKEFAVGIGGYDVANPLASTLVDPTKQELISEIFRGPVSQVETPLASGVAKAFVCRLGQNDIQGGIGEIGLIAEILWSEDFPSEVGTKFLFAVVHQPLNAKTYRHVSTYRIVIVL
jgi:hypothetical protein